MADLYLPVKGEYFDAMKSGEKIFEYRLRNQYWERRLVGRSYDNIVITKGYPRKDDADRRLVLPWVGCDETTITHPHFGPDPVDVYAIWIVLI